MAALPVYHVEFIPLERRLRERRTAPAESARLQRTAPDRRHTTGRRAEDRAAQTPFSV